MRRCAWLSVGHGAQIAVGHIDHGFPRIQDLGIPVPVDPTVNHIVTAITCPQVARVINECLSFRGIFTVPLFMTPHGLDEGNKTLAPKMFHLPVGMLPVRRIDAFKIHPIPGVLGIRDFKGRTAILPHLIY